jgi:cytochrome b6-f complex iron-sulfur subunit
MPIRSCAKSRCERSNGAERSRWGAAQARPRAAADDDRDPVALSELATPFRARPGELLRTRKACLRGAECPSSRLLASGPAAAVRDPPCAVVERSDGRVRSSGRARTTASGPLPSSPVANHAAVSEAKPDSKPEQPQGEPLRTAPLRGDISRRGLFSVLGAGWVTFSVASAAGVGAMVRFMMPNVLYEPPQEFKAGFPSEFAVGAVDERFKAAYGVWIVRESTGFYALSTVCTHLGCTPNWLAADEKFKCPCHGSGFVRTGINVEGPAPRPLERYKISLADDGQILIDKNTKFQEEKGQWAFDGAYLAYV